MIVDDERQWVKERKLGRQREDKYKEQVGAELFQRKVAYGGGRYCMTMMSDDD